MFDPNPSNPTNPASPGASSPAPQSSTPAPAQSSSSDGVDRRKRYSDAEKKKVTDWVADYNEKNKRGGITQAVKEFGISPVTITSWVRAAGGGKSKAKAKKAGTSARKSTGRRGRAKSTAATGGSKYEKMAKILAEMAQKEKELEELKQQYRQMETSI